MKNFSPANKNADPMKDYEDELCYADKVKDSDTLKNISMEEDIQAQFAFRYPEEAQDNFLENLPKELRATMLMKEEYNDDYLEDIYNQYENAMERRGREPISKENFFYHFFEGGSFEPTVSYGDSKKGHILGFYKNDIFIPTHFAPKSMRSGYELFKELATRKDLPTVTAITDDLAKTLMKMKGWHQLKTKFLAFFNSDLEDKVLVYNDAKGIRKKLISLVKEFWQETKKLKDTQDFGV